MSLLELFGIDVRGGDEPAALAPNPTDDWWYSMTPGMKTAAGISVNEAKAMTYSACWAATMLLSSSEGMLPLKLFRKRSGGGSDVMHEHRSHRLVHNRPNPEMTPMMFRSSRTAQQVNRGNCYSEIERNAGGQIDNLWPIHASRIPPETNIRRENGKLVYYVNNNDGSKTPIQADDMLHIPSPISEDGIVGMGVITQARLSIALGLATETHGAAYFGSGATPKTVITSTPGTGTKFKNKEEQDDFRRQWNEMHGGPENANRPAILPPGLDIKPLNFSAEDSQFLETRQFSIEEVARWYGVPPHLIGHLLRATYCMPADTLVLTEGGPRPIVDVAPGDRVWSYCNRSLVLSHVKAVACSGRKKVLRVRTTNRTLRLTDNHRIRVMRKANKFQEEWIQAGELAVGDTIITCHRTPGEGTTRLPSGRECSIGFAEFCGLLLSDGNISKASGKYVGVQIARSDNAGYMEHYREIIRSEFHRMSRAGQFYGEAHPGKRKLIEGDAAQIRELRAAGVPRKEVAGQYGISESMVKQVCAGTAWAKRRPVRMQVKLTEGRRQTRFKSEAAATELVLLGLSGVADTKRVPGWVFQLPESHRLAFLRGYLDGDGSCDKKGRLSYSSCNKLLLEDVRHLCMTCGVPVTNVVAATPKATHIMGRERVSAPRPQYFVTCSDPGANRRIGTNDPRYAERLENGKAFGRKSRNYPRFGGEGWNSEHCQLARVNSIELSEHDEPVYDLQVDGTESFIADGVVVHNSNIEHLSLEFVKYSLMRWLVVWEQELNRKLLTPEEQKTMYFKHNVDALERGDLASRTAAFQVELFNGKKSINEWRALDEENPIAEGGDTHWVQQPMIPVEIAMKGPQEATPAPAATPEPEPKDDDTLAKVGAAIALAMAPVVTSLSEVAVGLKHLSGSVDANHTATIARFEASEAEQQRLAASVNDLRSESEKLAAFQRLNVVTSANFNRNLSQALLRDVLGRLMSVEIHNVKQTAQTASKFDQRLMAFYDEKHRRTMELALIAPIGAALSAAGKPDEPAAFVRAYIDGHVAESVQQLLGCCDCQAEELPARVEACVAKWHEERTSITIGE